jgi:hypothetical protein
VLKRRDMKEDLPYPKRHVRQWRQRRSPARLSSRVRRHNVRPSVDSCTLCAFGQADVRAWRQVTPD